MVTGKSLIASGGKYMSTAFLAKGGSDLDMALAHMKFK
jgi:hypothetical protein